jgi:hypothetical protein
MWGGGIEEERKTFFVVKFDFHYGRLILVNFMWKNETAAHD